MRFDHKGFRKFAKGVAPLAALAFAAALSGCNGSVSIDGDEGKKLSELDLSGAAPGKLVIAGPDNVKISEGSKLAITVDGDPAAADHLRFTLKDGTLGILREKSWKDSPSLTVNVTMPAPSEVTLAGSGTVEAPALAANAKVTIAGSGDVRAATLSGDKFELTVAGSGSMHGGGAVKDLSVNLAGSGDADLAALRADKAQINMAGSGNAAFTSDGEVKASIMGSGTVTVKGRATCKVSAMGSGKLVCESGPATKDEE